MGIIFAEKETTGERGQVKSAAWSHTADCEWQNQDTDQGLSAPEAEPLPSLRPSDPSRVCGPSKDQPVCFLVSRSYIPQGAPVERLKVCPEFCPLRLTGKGITSTPGKRSKPPLRSTVHRNPVYRITASEVRKLNCSDELTVTTTIVGDSPCTE